MAANPALLQIAFQQIARRRIKLSFYQVIHQMNDRLIRAARCSNMLPKAIPAPVTTSFLFIEWLLSGSLRDNGAVEAADRQMHPTEADGDQHEQYHEAT